MKPPFEKVVAEHGPTVLRVVRAVLGHADADDAWSDTFLAAMKAYPDLPADANLQAWLVTIAHRKAIDIHRATSRRAVPVRETPDTPSRDHAADDHLDLTAAVAALPTRQRQAVAYHYWPACPTPRSPHCSTPVSPPPGVQQPMASPRCDVPTNYKWSPTDDHS